MAEKLKIIPLGGLNEIGKNMTVFEFGGEIIVVDCGMAFPGDDMYGIDSIIPDVTYLIKNRARIRGLFITHGHEDHVGAIPYVLKQVNMPIYCCLLYTSSRKRIIFMNTIQCRKTYPSTCWTRYLREEINIFQRPARA